jgi:hypothetical protein
MVAAHGTQDTDARLELLLQRSRPVPRAAFVHEAEQRLLPEREPAGARRLIRPLFAGAAAATGLACAAVVLGLAGGGPLAPGGGEDSRASQDCRFVTVEKRARVPRIVVDRDGQPSVRYHVQLVERRVKRCR